MADLTGRTIAGRYKVIETIGRGGMAEVLKVWDGERATHLALKILREDMAQDPVFLRRFRREAQTLERLQHPNIVRFYGLDQDGLLAFMLMDFIEGTSLRAEIFKQAGKPLPVSRILDVMRPICSALHYAHAQRIVHCDMKPGNILIDGTGKVLVSDFGIARMTESATVTMVGAGTPAYMAPEQARGEEPTAQSDIYALGVMLYEMTTGGERPFTGETTSTSGSTSEKLRWEHLYLEPPSPRTHNPNLSADLEALILKCLAKDPAARYQSAQELFSALEKALQVSSAPTLRLESEPPKDSAAAVPALALLPQAESAPIRKRSRLGALLVFIVGLAVIAGGYWLLSSDALSALYVPTPTRTPFPARPTSTPDRAATLQAAMTATQAAVVSRFAQPLILEIEASQPNVEDDFSIPADSSRIWNDSTAQGIEFVDGIARVSSTGWSGIGGSILASDFALEMDIIPQQLADDGWIGINFRSLNSQWYGFGFKMDGTAGFSRFSMVNAQLQVEDITMSVGTPNVVMAPGRPIHLLLVADGPEFAVYLDGKPAAYGRDETIKGSWAAFGAAAIAEKITVDFDNVRFWNLDELVSYPAPPDIRCNPENSGYDWKVAYIENFGNNINGWELQDYDDEYLLSRGFLDRNRYRIEALSRQAAHLYVPFPKGTYGPVMATVDIRSVGGDPGVQAGLFLRFTSWGNFYYVGLDRKGNLFFVRNYQDSWTQVLGPLYVSSYQRNATNRLTVIADGQDFIFMVNSQLVKQYHDNQPGPVEGQLGLAGLLPAEGNRATFEYDNLLICIP